MFVEELVRFGLSEKEARVYLTLLELKEATPNELAKATGINRSSTYVVLESLEKQGLAAAIPGKKLKKYTAAHPEQLARMAEHEATKRLEAKADIHRILPDLLSLHSEVKEKPRIHIYEGKQGFIDAFEETLKMKEKLMRVVSSGGDIQASLPDYLPRYAKRRMELGIKMYGIHPYEPVAHSLRELMPPWDTVLLIPHERWEFISDFTVFDNTVAFMLHKEQLCIFIESKAVADSMKKMFDLAFEEAKRLNIP